MCATAVEVTFHLKAGTDKKDKSQHVHPYSECMCGSGQAQGQAETANQKINPECCAYLQGKELSGNMPRSYRQLPQKLQRVSGLTTAMRHLLDELLVAEREGRLEEAEVVCEGVECWVGYRRVSRNTINALLRLLALSQDRLGGAEHYSLNCIGRELSAQPALAEKVRLAILHGKPFAVQNGRIIEM
jgi:hypothetical protein